MTDRDRINALLDQLAMVQQKNDELEIYVGILENLLGVTHLDNLD